MFTRTFARSLYLSIAVLFVLLFATGASAQSQTVKPTLTQVRLATVPCGQVQLLWQGYMTPPATNVTYWTRYNVQGLGETNIQITTPHYYWDHRANFEPDYAAPADMRTTLLNVEVQPHLVQVLAYAAPCHVAPAGYTVTNLSVEYMH